MIIVEARKGVEEEEEFVNKDLNTGYVWLECSGEEDHSDTCSNSEKEKQESSQVKEPETTLRQST